MKMLHMTKGAALTNGGIQVCKATFANLTDVTKRLEADELVVATYPAQLANRRKAQLFNAFLAFEYREFDGQQVYDVYRKVDPNSREGREIRRARANARLKAAQ